MFIDKLIIGSFLGFILGVVFMIVLANMLNNKGKR